MLGDDCLDNSGPAASNYASDEYRGTFWGDLAQAEATGAGIEVELELEAEAEAEASSPTPTAAV